MWQKISKKSIILLNLIVCLNTELALDYCAEPYSSCGSKHSLHVVLQLSCFLKQFIILKFSGVDEQLVGEMHLLSTPCIFIR